MDSSGKEITDDMIYWRSIYRISVWRHQNPDPAMQIIVTDGGPWASHNVVCAVCGDRKAILDLSIGVFLPCDTCRSEGWILKKRKWYRRRAR